jgi:hypothetical protein
MGRIRTEGGSEKVRGIGPSKRETGYVVLADKIRAHYRTSTVYSFREVQPSKSTNTPATMVHVKSPKYHENNVGRVNCCTS